MITVTENAVKKLKFEMAKIPNLIGVRISVSGGGCSGLQYGMQFEEESNEFDVIEEHHGTNFFINNQMETFLAGIVIDYVESLYEIGFTFSNPNAKSSCGCGKSFNA